MAGGNRSKKTARGARPVASASQRQPQDVYASALDAFVTVFLDDLYKEIRASVNEVTGEVENALHQKMESNGDKQNQSRQLTIIVKGANKYMTKVHSEVEKNFDKLELYMRRNIVAISPSLIDDVTKRYLTRIANGNSDGALPLEGTSALVVSKEEQEKRLEGDLESLRQQLRDLTEENQRLELQHEALDAKVAHFHKIVEQVEFIERAPTTTLSPLQHTVENLPALQESLQRMSSITAQLEHDSAQFKRQRLDTRASYRNMRDRFLARTNATKVVSNDDLKVLNAQLQSM